MNIADYAKKRYSTKAFDPARKVPDEIIAQLRELVRFSPSSVNSQPWHFVVASGDEAKARIATGRHSKSPICKKLRDEPIGRTVGGA